MMRRLLPLLVAWVALAGCTQQQQAPKLNADARLRLADAAAAAGNDELAGSLYAAAAANAPNDTAVQLRAAAALAKAGHVAQARQVLAARLRANPHDAEAIRARAALDLGEGRTAEAEAALDTALAQHPDDPATLTDKAVALDMKADHAGAQALYRRALALAPDDAAIRNDLALSLMLAGKVREGIDVLAPLEDTAGLPPRARATLALLFSLNGEAERAQNVLGHPLPENYVAEVEKALRPGS